MTGPPSLPNQSLPRGILAMSGAMACFAIADTLIKISSTTLSPAHTGFFLMAGGLVIFGALALMQGENLLNRAAFAPILFVRYFAELFAMFCMVNALSKVPLSTVGAIIQATPLVVVAGAVLFLDEKVSWRRWSAIFVGFIGVLMIVQPGAGTFEPQVFYAVGAMAGLAVRDLTSRMTPPSIGSASLATFTMIASVPPAAAWVLLTQDSLIPGGVNWGLTAGMVIFGAFGYLMLITSMRIADVSAVSPYRYLRLIFLLVIGVVFFAERPDALTLLGAAVIIASGLYTMWRDRIVTKGLKAQS